MLDDIDAKILEMLAENSHITATDLAPLIGLSVPATNKRINKLSAANIIERFTVCVSPEEVGKPLLAFINIVLERLTYVDDLLRVLNTDKDILECFAVAGEFDYIVKVRAKNMLDLENKILSIKEIEGVTKTNTIISLYTHKYLPTILPD